MKSAELLFPVAGISALAFVASLFFWATGSIENPIAVAILAVIAFGLGAFALYMQRFESVENARADRTGDGIKRKNVDMYTLIDRLVDDLTPEERAYLLQRLMPAHSVEDDEDVATTLEALLEERHHNRLT